MYIAGVDTGGSSTRCIIIDESFSLCGIGEAGPGNYRVAGTTKAKENVEASIQNALVDADVDPDAHIVGGFGMGTLDTDEDYDIITDFLNDIAVVDERYIENDVVVAYYSVTAGGPGVVVIAGTGAMAFGRDEAGERARASGWGWLFGDEGSGYDAARKGLQAASKAADGRGDATDLLDAACNHFGLESFDDVFTTVYDDIDHAKDIATFAEPVAETAAAGDDVALDIVDNAAAELSNAAIAVIDKLDLAPAPIVACQGGFGSADVVASRFESKVTDAYPQTEIVDAVTNPVVGSVALVAENRGTSITREELVALDRAVSEMTSS